MRWPEYEKLTATIYPLELELIQKKEIPVEAYYLTLDIGWINATSLVSLGRHKYKNIFHIKY